MLVTPRSQHAIVRITCGFVVCILLATAALPCVAQDGATLPPSLTHYQGREIAQTMSYHGAKWLIRDRREREERCSLMWANLGVKQGMTVCDMGCGNGFHTLQLAKMVGPKGKVLAVDIQPEMLKLLRERTAEQKIENVKPILGTLADPKLPAGEVDMILCVDVYHEFSHPEHMLDSMRRSLTKDGRVVMVEYRKEDPEVPIKPLHKMSKRQVTKEMRANGLKLMSEFERLPWQHMLFYGRDETYVERELPGPAGSTPAAEKSKGDRP